ncbi:MAG: PaaI family thioesterase [Pseudomonadota bacterium]
MGHDTATADAERLALTALEARGLSFPLDQGAVALFETRFNQIPAMQHMGARLDLASGPRVCVHLAEVLAHHRGGMGTEAVNGAVLSGMADCALGVAGVLQFGAERAGTVEMSIKFVRAAVGNAVTVHAVALKRSASVVFAEAELYCEGHLCALATGMVSQPGSQAGERFS